MPPDDVSPGPARLAAVDQRLAEIARLDRHDRVVMYEDVATAVAAVILIAAELVVRPPLSRWELIAALATVALLAASGFVQGLMLRNYRAEIRELRVRGHDR